MNFNYFNMEGVVEIIPKVFKDERGFFMETYNQDRFEAEGIVDRFVQTNKSFSQKGVLRGLHYQLPPYAQAKLVSVVKGRALDVIVDLREDSPTLGKYLKYELSEDLHNMLYIPAGFAHGFLALEDCIFQYMCSALYHPPSEGGIIWNDATLNITWDTINPMVSEKDLKLQSFNEFMKDIK